MLTVPLVSVQLSYHIVWNLKKSDSAIWWFFSMFCLVAYGYQHLLGAYYYYFCKRGTYI